MSTSISTNGGEREAFEAWRKRTTKSPDSYDSIALHGFGDDANYADRTTRSMWVSWQARATLAAAPLEGAGVPVAVISERALQRLAQGKSHCVHAYAKVVDEDDVQLYRAAPQPEPSVQPPALTDAQIQEIVGATEAYWATSKLFILDIARAIEAAHKIGGKE